MDKLNKIDDMKTNTPKVVILCGGMGTRLREETEFKPKPMVEIGSKPILWHIMKIYASYGFKDFILCLGYKGEMIKQYFLNYGMISCDITVELGSGNIKVHNSHQEQGWRITLADTGENAMTGARVKRIERYIITDMDDPRYEVFAEYKYSKIYIVELIK